MKGTSGGGLYIDGGSGDDNLEADGALKDTTIGGLGADTIDIAAGAAVIWEVHSSIQLTELTALLLLTVPSPFLVRRC